MEKRIIEINGMKLEVDLSDCRVIDNYRVGDSIKVLKKEYSNYESLPGVIVGFDNFEKLPTIIIAYLKIDYSEAKIKFVYFNSESKEIEICPMNDADMPFEKKRVIEMFDREIYKKEEELDGIKRQKEFFLAQFGKYFNK
jgi:hypothetical protein